MLFKKEISKHLKDIIYFVFIITLTSCTKQVAGPKGDAGTPGGTGNVKQMVSTTFNVPGSDWTLTGRNWQADVFMAEINDNVMTKGEVKVFMLLNGFWYPLPYNTSDIFTQYSFEKGKISLDYYKDHGTAPTPPTASYKVVIYYP